MKKALPYILSVSLFAYLIIVLTFVSAKFGELKCVGVQVIVDDTEGNAFIEEDDVLQMIKRHYGSLDDICVVNVDKDSMEHVLESDPVIKSAEVYYSLDGNFHVKIIQRNPVLRVMSDRGYYVDEDGKKMPLSAKYTSRVVVATGNISDTFACDVLYPFVIFLKEDRFWEALIEQIVVSKGNEVSLIPKVGNFRIVLGTLENVERKMENLRLFLQDGIVLKGWNLYKEINLKFENQIVCVKK